MKYLPYVNDVSYAVYPRDADADLVALLSVFRKER